MFKHPTAEYRATPFWAWNCALDPVELMRQIEVFQKMGFGGFHMHVRTGMDTEYLGDEFMRMIEICTEKAKEQDMLAWLYDEDRWPSGAAGGFVTQNPKYRLTQLLLTDRPYSENFKANEDFNSSGVSKRTQNGRLLTCFDIVLDSDGFLTEYSEIEPTQDTNNTKIYAYIETAAPSPWFNNQTYANTLDPKAIEFFINLTHEKYKLHLARDFGSVIPAIFTDEPQFAHKSCLKAPNERPIEIILPWTEDIEQTFSKSYSSSLMAHLPELLFELPDGEVSLTRYRYHDHIAQRFCDAFAKQCGEWCEVNDLMLTGHMMEEPTLKSQTAALGEAMRSLRHFQLPGIDILCDNREFTTAKQAQSIAHQYGREGVLSELYGVTNWDFDFRGHKLQGDWQAALGVSVRVPHLSWVSMAGEAKRDYPTSFNYQSPWHEKYRYIEDHYARVASAMTRGEPMVKIGVIHPVESYWLYWGNEQQTADIRDGLDECFGNIADWLLKGTLDFDYICESLLPENCIKGDITGEFFSVGKSRYNCIVVAGCKTLRTTTLQRLEWFAEQGGRIVIVGEPPSMVDAVPSDEFDELFGDCDRVMFERTALLNALEEERIIDIRDSAGVRSRNLIYGMRRERQNDWLFVANADIPKNVDSTKGEKHTFSIDGEYSVELYDTLTGDLMTLKSKFIGGKTVFDKIMYAHDSLLLKLNPPQYVRLYETFCERISIPTNTPLRYLNPVMVTLHEKNVLVLDMAEYALNDDAYHSVEEILRIDGIIRAKLGYNPRNHTVAQPWVEKDTSTPHTLHLRYTVVSQVELSGVELAMEKVENAEIILNGLPVKCEQIGYYVDLSIKTISIGNLKKGENYIDISIPFGRKTDLEACYLLGDFGVKVHGCTHQLTSAVEQLAFGDITRQGLPFYGGNITYHLPFKSQETNDGFVEINAYRGQMLSLSLDDNELGNIVFSPYRLELPRLKPGEHRLDVTFYGNRINPFGQLHFNNHATNWWGPDSWRPSGQDFSYEYQFWPQGIIKSPEIFL